MDGQGSSRGDPDLPGGAGETRQVWERPQAAPDPVSAPRSKHPPPHSSEHLILWFFQDSKNKKAKKGKRQ